MSRQLESTLVEALDLLEQGMPVVRILSTYPELADELRPYMLTAADLNSLTEPASAAAEQASKRKFLQQAVELQDERRPFAATWLRQILVSGLAVMLFLFMGSAMLALASGEAIPGDTLYDTKLFLEAVRLNYSANPDVAAALIEQFHQERLDEVAALLASGRHEKVVFSGSVEDLTPEKWIVEGIPVVITSSTIISDEVEVGFVVWVTGMTSAGGVAADGIEVMNGRVPEPDQVDSPPLIEPSPSPAPTVEPVNTSDRPDILRPDDEIETAPPALDPPPVTTREDDLPGDASFEHGDDSNPDGPEEGDDDSGQREGDAAGDNSPNDEGVDNDNPDVASYSEDSGEESNDDAEEYKMHSGDEDDSAEDDSAEDDSAEDDSAEDDSAKDDSAEDDGS